MYVCDLFAIFAHIVCAMFAQSKIKFMATFKICVRTQRADGYWTFRHTDIEKFVRTLYNLQHGGGTIFREAHHGQLDQADFH